MKKIHKYVLSNFVAVLLFTTVFLVLLFVLSDFFGRFSTFLKNGVSIYTIAEYYIYFTPYVLYYLTPFIFAFSSLLTLGVMSMRNEIIVMRASGINLITISKPILLLSLLSGLLMFFANEYLVGKALDKAYFIKTFEFSSRTPHRVWTESGNYIFRIGDIDLRSHTAGNLTLYRVKNGRIESVLDAKEAIFKKGRVILKDVKVVYLTSRFKQMYYKKLILKVNLDFKSLVKSPQKSSYTFNDLLSILKKHPKQERFYQSLLVSKLLYPLSPLVLFMLSLVFVLKTTPRKSDLVKNLFVGALLFLAYIALFELLVSMGKISMIQPVVTLVLFVLSWLSVSVYNLLKLGV